MATQVVRVASLALVLASAACRREPLITARLVDGKASPATNGWPLFLVEVHHGSLAPIQGMDRLWRRFERVDTVPFVRSLGAVAVLGDTMVVGVGGFSNTAFQYDVRTKALTRSPQPAWLDSAAYTPPASLAPHGQYIVYLANQPDGTTRLAVRSWPDGRIAAQSPPVHIRLHLGPRQGGGIWWQNAESFFARFPVSDSGPSWASVNGRVAANGVELDWKIYPDLNPQTAAPPPQAVEPVNTLPDTARWARAEREIVQLPLSKFPELPPAFVRELEGCTIPQTYVTGRPHNVIHGTFASSQQLDWAVLCSRGGESVIRIWWGGPVQCPRELRTTPNRSYLQTIGEGRIGFSRVIGTTDFYSAEDGSVKLEHDAIEDAFAEKASTIFMCRNGQWITLSGAD